MRVHPVLRAAVAERPPVKTSAKGSKRSRRLFDLASALGTAEERSAALHREAHTVLNDDDDDEATSRRD